MWLSVSWSPSSLLSAVCYMEFLKARLHKMPRIHVQSHWRCESHDMCDRIPACHVSHTTRRTTVLSGEHQVQHRGTPAAWFMFCCVLPLLLIWISVTRSVIILTFLFFSMYVFLYPAVYREERGYDRHEIYSTDLLRSTNKVQHRWNLNANRGILQVHTLTGLIEISLSGEVKTWH